jgi:hypothetical protein
MSKQKTTIGDAKKRPVTSIVRGNGVVAGARAPEPEVVALELDDSDFGGDPYNHTGSFCVLKFDKDD